MSQRNLILYRMVLPDHICPYGLLAKRMLEDAGLPFDDRLLTSREDVDAFQAKHDVATTPQIFVDDERIGGSDALAEWLETVGA
jgi:glutaredoxin